MASEVQFVPRDSDDFKLIAKIAKRAAKMDAAANPEEHGDRMHHAMNVSACHASGNPLRLAELLQADDFNFAHDIFGIDRHICRDTGAMLNHFSPRFSARDQELAA